MTEVKIPRENANDDSVLITEVKVASGAFIDKGAPLFSFETSKATVDFDSPISGYISNLRIKAGELAKVDSVVCTISDSFAVEDSLTDATEEIISIDTELSGCHLSDAARKLLEAGQQPIRGYKWISSSSFSTESLVERITDNSKLVNTNQITPIKSSLPHTLVTLDRRKQLEIRALSLNSSYLNSTIGIEVKFGVRRVNSTMFSDSILDLVLYESYNLLKSNFSDLNRYYFDVESIGVFEKVIPGYALDNGNNLTVLNAGEFSTLQELEGRLISQITRYEENQLLASDLTTTTFTVSDLSSTTVEFMLPLVNGQQTFILGIVRAEGGFKLYGTFDHRVTDGRRFSEFLGELRRRLLLYCNKNQIQTASEPVCYYCEKTLSEEKLLRNRGFIKTDDGNGEKLICRNCFDGW